MYNLILMSLKYEEMNFLVLSYSITPNTDKCDFSVSKY